VTAAILMRLLHRRRLAIRLLVGFWLAADSAAGLFRTLLCRFGSPFVYGTRLRKL